MKRIVIFDFDNVIIRGQSQLYLVNYLIKKRKIHFLVALQIYFWFLLKKIGFQISPNRIRNIAYKTFKGWTIEYLENFFSEFYIKVLKNFYIYETRQLINHYLIKHDEVIIVSASLKKIIENCLPHLNVNCCIATELEMVDNICTGSVKGAVPFAQEKCTVIKEYIEKKGYSWKSCIAYTDDFSDLKLLNLVSFPFVINPDPKLREVAIKKGWQMYDF